MTLKLSNFESLRALQLCSPLLSQLIVQQVEVVLGEEGHGIGISEIQGNLKSIHS